MCSNMHFLLAFQRLEVSLPVLGVEWLGSTSNTWLTCLGLQTFLIKFMTVCSYHQYMGASLNIFCFMIIILVNLK